MEIVLVFLTIFLIFVVLGIENPTKPNKRNKPTKLTKNNSENNLKSATYELDKSEVEEARYDLNVYKKKATIEPYSVQPQSISVKPKRRIDLVEGEHRIFQNVYIEGKQYSFGFPKLSCRDQRVWVGLDKNEVERISKSAAQERLDGKSLDWEVKKLLENPASSSNKYQKLNSTTLKHGDFKKTGLCRKCNKVLKGNTKKPLCYECWSKDQKKAHGYGYCNLCSKKLQGDKSKPLCYACWSNK